MREKRGRGRPEDPTLAQIDDALAGLVGVFPAVAVLIARQRVNLTRKDLTELQQVVEAAGRARDALAMCRRLYTEAED